MAGERIKWFTETDIAVADDPELLTLMHEAGCAEVLIGLESPTRAGVAGVELRRDWKQSRFEDYQAAIERIQSHGIAVNGCFVLGLDGDGPEVFEAVERFVRESGQFDVQITVMTAFPGTPLYARLKAEGRLLTERAWEQCTLFDVNFRPKGMSPETLQHESLELGRRLYTEEERAARRRAVPRSAPPLPAATARHEVQRMNTSADRQMSGWRIFFLVAALYDMLLGVAFVVLGEQILGAIDMELPPHIAYIQLAAVFIFVQGFSYLLALPRPARQPRHRPGRRGLQGGLCRRWRSGTSPSAPCRASSSSPGRSSTWASWSASCSSCARPDASAPPDRQAVVIHEALHRPVPVELTARTTASSDGSSAWRRSARSPSAWSGGWRRRPSRRRSRSMPRCWPAGC